jgi:hypothetical protein
MTREAAIRLAEQAIDRDSRQEFTLFSAALQRSLARYRSLSFSQNAKRWREPSFVRGELFIEVDEASETAKIVRNP